MSTLVMTSEEQKKIDSHVEQMMDWAKTRSAEAEQLALDSTRLLACTTDRLDRLQNQNFFKRCWNRFNGNAGEMERANVNDLIQMQKIAFRYVNMLGEQQLLMAHSLLSLKNNLISLAVKEEETRDLITMLAQRTLERFENLESRVEQLEISTNLQSWLLGLEERDYDEKIPTTYMRLFRVINDFYQIKNDNWNYNDLMFMRKAIRTVGINPKQKLSLNTFIDHLTDEIQNEGVGFDAYGNAITMFVPEGIDNYSKFAVDTISSPVFVSMHGLKMQYMDRLDIVEELQDEMDISISEALKRLLRRSIANMNVNLDYEFPLAETAIEILGCIRLMYKLNDNSDSIKNNIVDEEVILTRSVNSFKPQTLYANVRELQTHPLLEVDASEDVKKLYIQGFALLAGGNNFCEEQYNYLRSLANVLKCASALEDLDQFCSAPQNFQVRKWIAALDTDMMKYSWLLDGVMILCQLPESAKDTVKMDVLEEGAKSLRVMQAKDFISPAVDLCLAESAADLYKDIRKINQKTDAWEHILEYRNLSLNGAFDSVIEKLNSLSMDCIRLSWKGTSLLAGIDMSACSYFDTGDYDDGFFEKMKTKAARAIVETERSSTAKKLKEYYNEIKSFIEAHSSEFRDANSVLSTFSIAGIYPEDKMIEPDIDNSALNSDWYDDYTGFMDKISNALESYRDTASALVEQLKMFEKGQYHTSILESKKAEKEEKEKQERAEREAKKYIEISTVDGKYRVDLSWNEIDNVPFDLNDIGEIGYAGGNWLVMAKEPYYLDKNLNWYKISELSNVYVTTLFQVNGYIVLTSSYSAEMWISKDCNNWKKVNLPTDEGIIGLIYYQDKYVLYTNDRRMYSYVEKGLIFDSKAEGYYYSTIAWQSSSLDGVWKKWNDASYTDEGMVLNSNIACNNNIIIGGFSYDWSFKNDKKKSSDNACVSCFTNSRWKNTTWPEDMSNSGKFYFINNHGIYINTYNPVLLSEKGYEWKVVDGIRPYEEGGLCGNVFLTKPNSDGQSLISLDGLSISQLTVSEKGRWRGFGFGDGKVLGLYAKSEHELSLLLGTLNIIRQ